MSTVTQSKAIGTFSEPPIIGSMKAFQRDRLKLFSKIARLGKDVSLMHFGPFPLYVINSPEVVQAVLVEHANDFEKGIALARAIGPVARKGLFINEGESWRKQRKLIAPALTARHVASYADTMAAYSEKVQQRWRDGAELRIDNAMMALTMSIVGKTLFDADVLEETDELGAAITATMQHMQYATNHLFPMPPHWPTPRGRRTMAALAVIDRRVKAMIAERRASGVERDDLLSRLLAARDENGEGMSDEQIRDEAVTLFIAGHETTANTLAWCWYLLTKNPAAYDRMVQEVDSVLGGRAVTAADLPNLPYTAQVFKETLRLYPTADSITRTALRDVDVAGYHLKKQDIVVFPVYTIHRRADFYPDPERFDPDRFLPENEKKLPRHAFMPFGAGPRICIGNHFALMEGQIVLATLAQRVRFELVPGQVIEPEAVFATRQRNGCRVIVHRR